VIDLLVVIGWLFWIAIIGIVEHVLVFVGAMWRDNHGITHRRRRPWR
jgi:hypothetical protein